MTNNKSDIHTGTHAGSRQLQAPKPTHTKGEEGRWVHFWCVNCESTVLLSEQFITLWRLWQKLGIIPSYLRVENCSYIFCGEIYVFTNSKRHLQSRRKMNVLPLSHTYPISKVGYTYCGSVAYNFFSVILLKVGRILRCQEWKKMGLNQGSINI